MRRLIIAGVLAASLLAASLLAVEEPPAAAEPIGIATTVDGPDDDHGITIKVPIDCAGCRGKRGPDGTPLADYWKRVAETWWTNAFEFFPYKECFTFKLVIDITSKGADFQGTKDRHIVQVGEKGSTDPPSGFKGTTELNPSKGGNDGTRSFHEARDGIWNEDISEATIAHEVGHLFGLGDDYEVVSQNPRMTRPKPGRAGTLMADGGVIDPALVDRIGKQVEKLLGGLPCVNFSGPIRTTYRAGIAGVTCTAEENGTVTLGVVDKKVTGVIDTSGSETCTGPAGSITEPTAVVIRLSGRFADGEFRLRYDEVIGEHALTPSCLVQQPIQIPVERGTGSAELVNDQVPGYLITCNITVEREADEDEAVG